MHRFAEQFAQFCRNRFDLATKVQYDYRSLSVCLIDCIFSLRARYDRVTLPVVYRYANKYLNGDPLSFGDTISDLIAHIDAAGGADSFAAEILENRQKSGGILKGQICYQLAKNLQLLHINTIEDFRSFPSPELLEIVIRSVKGIGPAGTNYLFMLAGDNNRCKPDVHIHHAVRDACGCDLDDEDCQHLFRDTVSLLKEDFPDLCVRSLDGIIWRKYQNGNAQT